MNKELFEKTREEIRETNRQIISQGLSMVSSAFVLVAALAWNEAIKALISTYVKENSGLVYQFVYAAVVTIIAVIITVRLNKIAARYKDQ